MAMRLFIYLLCLSAIALCGMHWHNLGRIQRTCEMSYMWPVFEEVPVVFNTLSIRYKLYRYRDANAASPGATHIEETQ